MSDMIKVGDYTYGIPIIKNWGEKCTLTIGRFCSIAGNVQIYLGGNHRSDWCSTFPFPAFKEFENWKYINGFSYSKGDVVIGNDVWIGNDVTILSGVTIGDGAVIGAECVVAKDVEPYAVVIGNPQIEVKKRFTDYQIAKLLYIKWWNWDIEKIKLNIPLICSDNIDDFIHNSL